MLKIAYHPLYCHPLPEGHRFPMAKYELIPAQLQYEGVCSESNFFAPPPADERWILGVHDAQYWRDLQDLNIDAKMVRRVGFPLSAGLVAREIVIAQGTITGCHFALQDGVAMNVAGGTHHAYADRGEGFCLLNDVAIAANYLLENKLAKRILIIDLDVHQGNGTAVIFKNEPRVFTFSMHGKDNYPLFKEQSDLDIALETGTGDSGFLKPLNATLQHLVQRHKPDFAFYISGVDILETDRLGKLSVSKEGCKQRDELVFDTCLRHGIPVMVSMGGGYSPRIGDIVDAHCQTFKAANAAYF